MKFTENMVSYDAPRTVKLTGADVWPGQMYSIGKTVYIVAYLGDDCYNLISLWSGNRYSNESIHLDGLADTLNCAEAVLVTAPVTITP